MPLTEVAVRSAKPREKPYKLADGLGMYLLVSTSGSRLWRLKYRFGGKEKLLSFGAYPAVGLKDARARRDEARRILAAGQDPAVAKQQTLRASRLAALNAFERIAREFLEKRSERWSKRYASEICTRLECDIFPDLGARPIADISAPELLAVIRKIEARGATDMAHRMVQTCGQIFRYGIATGVCSRDVAADLRGALTPHITKPMPAIRPEQLPELLAAIAGYEGKPVTRLGMKLLALTFLRTSELIGAQWPEFDVRRALWTVPAPRMKMKDEHLVPLSRQALAVLDELRSINGERSCFVFAVANSHKHIAENTFRSALYRLGYHSRMTGHGFRAVASTILNEAREHGEHSFSFDVIERQLAHVERNQVRAAYNRAEYILDRRSMMQWWGDFLDRQAGGAFLKPRD